MNERPLASIIISSFNYGRFLGAAIDSALDTSASQIKFKAKKSELDIKITALLFLARFGKQLEAGVFEHARRWIEHPTRVPSLPADMVEVRAGAGHVVGEPCSAWVV